jgi:hypothetical protein
LIIESGCIFNGKCSMSGGSGGGFEEAGRQPGGMQEAAQEKK